MMRRLLITMIAKEDRLRDELAGREKMAQRHKVIQLDHCSINGIMNCDDPLVLL